jgi:chromosome segregation ATPase
MMCIGLVACFTLLHWPCSQAECTQLRNQLAIARTDAESAQQRLQQQGGRLASDQSRLQQQGQQLGQLVELQHQAEELQQQLAVCKQRLAATEAQVGVLQPLVGQWFT